jgi:hypothetical protein
MTTARLLWQLPAEALRFDARRDAWDVRSAPGLGRARALFVPVRAPADSRKDVWTLALADRQPRALTLVNGPHLGHRAHRHRARIRRRNALPVPDSLRPAAGPSRRDFRQGLSLAPTRTPTNWRKCSRNGCAPSRPAFPTRSCLRPRPRAHLQRGARRARRLRARCNLARVAAPRRHALSKALPSSPSLLPVASTPPASGPRTRQCLVRGPCQRGEGRAVARAPAAAR